MSETVSITGASTASARLVALYEIEGGRAMGDCRGSHVHRQVGGRREPNMEPLGSPALRGRKAERS
jgi:hypothetical protein